MRSIKASRTSKRYSHKRPKKKPPVSARVGNPFAGTNVTLIKPFEKTYVAGSGEVFRLWVDPSGLSSGWESTGQYVPTGIAGIPKPPDVGTIPPGLIAKLKTDPHDIDSVRTASAASFCNENARYNAAMYEGYINALLYWQRDGRRRKEPAAPRYPEFDPKYWIKGMPYYRPANFAQVYDWMQARQSGTAEQDPNAEVKFPPEVQYNQN